VRAGNIHSSWAPKITHPSIPPEQVEAFSKIFATGLLLSGIRKSWVVSDEWNKLFPDYKFADFEEFLSEPWAGKP
jgi:hypothetical protein